MNLEAYKLAGDHVRLTSEGACRPESPLGEPEVAEPISELSNINVFEDHNPKGLTKNSLSKIQKASINSVIRNNLEVSDHESVRILKNQFN